MIVFGLSHGEQTDVKKNRWKCEVEIRRKGDLKRLWFSRLEPQAKLEANPRHPSTHTHVQVPDVTALCRRVEVLSRIAHFTKPSVTGLWFQPKSSTTRGRRET